MPIHETYRSDSLLDCGRKDIMGRIDSRRHWSFLRSEVYCSLTKIALREGKLSLVDTAIELSTYAIPMPEPIHIEVQKIFSPVRFA